MQSPLRLLHARARDDLPPPIGPPLPSTRSSGSPGWRRASVSRSVRLTGGEPLMRKDLAGPGRAAGGDRVRRPRHDDERRCCSPTRPTSWSRPGSAGSTSAATRSAAERFEIDPSTWRSRHRPRRDGRGRGGRARAGEGERRAAPRARTTTRSSISPASPAHRSDRAVHRVHAARRRR